ncbi:MAG: phosphotransferase [Deltaproteobacteria bacterium]|nr:phosphotransferase [Deltaproteobacteria bacterium]
MKNINYYLIKKLPDLGCCGRIRVKPLKGDGSDRLVFRVYCGRKALILVHYPAGMTGCPSENDSFFWIASHLRSKGLPCPVVYDYSGRRGQFLLEDFGDLSLADAIKGQKTPFILNKYLEIIKLLITIQVEGREGFRTDWCYDTALFDGDFSWKRESEYFIREFVGGFLGLAVSERIRSEMREIAGRIDEEKNHLFLYRDFQSRNIMVRENGYGLIDFQAGRLGPPQYDLASLLIDPYVRLEPVLQEQIRDCYIQLLLDRIKFNRNKFIENYHFIGLQRNLQILGAFSFLSRVKGKHSFEQFIVPAVTNLKRWINFPAFKGYRGLRRFLGEF